VEGTAYTGFMLEARRASLWNRTYNITVDGVSVVTWKGSVWKSGGQFEVGGRRYVVTSNAFATRYEMVDQTGMVVASARRVGRKNWTVEAEGRTHQFRRASMWREEQELLVDGQRVGSVRRPSMWRTDAIADLPTLPLATQIFVLCVVLTMWDNAATAAAASS
jgi:hypothetical protein